MPDFRNDGIRLLVEELAESAPAPPPLPQQPAARAGPRWRWIAVPAAGVAVVVVVAVSLLSGGESTQDASAESTVAAVTTEPAPSVTSVADAADTTAPDPMTEASIEALADACAAFIDDGDVEEFRTGVAAAEPAGGDRFFDSIDVQMARWQALLERGDDEDAAEQLSEIADALVGYGTEGCGDIVP